MFKDDTAARTQAKKGRPRGRSLVLSDRFRNKSGVPFCGKRKYAHEAAAPKNRNNREKDITVCGGNY